jgi:hypothetical protein
MLNNNSKCVGAVTLLLSMIKFISDSWQVRKVTIEVMQVAEQTRQSNITFHEVALLLSRCCTTGP